jgi:hypothetical protein
MPILPIAEPEAKNDYTTSTTYRLEAQLPRQ